MPFEISLDHDFKKLEFDLTFCPVLRKRINKNQPKLFFFVQNSALKILKPATKIFQTPMTIALLMVSADIRIRF